MPDEKMNEFLSRAYGFSGPQASQEDLQKTAAVAFLKEAAAKDGIDLEKLSDAQVETLAQHYFSKTAELPPQLAAAQEKKDEEPPKKKEEKDEDMSDEEKKAAAEMAEADFLGRQMAYAFVQELDTIQKTAAAQAEQPQEVPEAFLKLAEQRALEFLQEKVAAGELCSCGDPSCDGTCETAKTAQAQPSEVDQVQAIDGLAAQMLQEAGYGKFLQS